MFPGIFSIVFIFIIVMSIIQIRFILILSKWAKILKRKVVTQEETEQVLNDLNKVLWIPNHPKYWENCKQIYYGIINSRDVSYDIKMKVFDKFDKLKVHGIRAPRH